MQHYGPRGRVGRWAFLWMGVVVAVVLVQDARAQVPEPPPPEPPTFELPEVIVPGKRPQPTSTTPAYVTAISGEELRRLGFLTLGDALAFVAEAYTRVNGAGLGGSQQASIRGSTPQQVLVVVDGVPLNATAQFGVNLATITLAEVERVEVLRGPYSALHGDFAVIQVTTRRGPARSALVSAGTPGAAQGSLRLGGDIGSLVWGLGNEYASTAGDRPNADATRWTGTAHLSVATPAGATLSLGVNRTTGESGVPGPTSSPSLTDRLADGRTTLSLEWQREAPDGIRSVLRAWTLDDRLGFTSSGFASDSRGNALGAEWQLVAEPRPGNVLTWGIGWQQASFDYGDSFSAFSASGSTTALYGQYDTAVGGRALAGVGLRYESDSTYGTRLDPRAGVVYFLKPDLRLRASIGQTSRAPTFGELYFPTCSNPNLRPERAWSADLGLESTARPGLTLRANMFYTDATDLIVGGCNPQNVGAARIAGASVEAVGHLRERWFVNANVTWQDGLDRVTGQQLLRVPNLEANLVLRYVADEQQSFSVLANYVANRIDLDFSTSPATRVTVPGYVTVSVRYERPLGTLRLRIGIDNVFDAQFETLKGFPGPGRTVFVQAMEDF